MFNLAGKGKLAVLQTATPICPEDLTEKIAAEENGDKGLWGEYFKMFDAENVADKGHSESLEFYKEHKEEMDEGSQVFNPTRYKESDGHISALQALLEKRHMIGDAAFSAEM